MSRNWIQDLLALQSPGGLASTGTKATGDGWKPCSEVTGAETYHACLKLPTEHLSPEETLDGG